MKPFFTGLAIATPTVAALLYFSLLGREDVKQDQAEARVEQKIEAAKFDRDFAAAWDGKPIRAPEAERIAELEKERETLRAARQKSDREIERDIADLKAALETAGSKP